MKIGLANGASCAVPRAFGKAHRANIARWIGVCAISAALGAIGGCATPNAVAKSATGDLQLSYAMPQAQGEQVPYRVFLPSTWRADRQWPLVVVLHGYAANANSPFVEAEGELQRQAEKHGFVLVAPNGYNGMADYGANLPLPSLLSRMDKPLQMKTEQESALAEADVLNVVERVSRDYNVDARRIYLMGNSMGMTGTLHLAAKMPEKWCAISPSDGPPWPNYPVERLRSIAVLFGHGDKDDIAKLSDTRELTERAKAAGVEASMFVVPGGIHATAWTKHLPQTFDFFAAHDCRR